jgi:hypothetical protein
MPRTGPRWMRFMRWVVKPDILLRRRLEGTTAWDVVRKVGCQKEDMATYDFIYDAFVGVEVEGETGIAGRMGE